jgi:hypothetical protein
MVRRQQVRNFMTFGADFLTSSVLALEPIQIMPVITKDHARGDKGRQAARSVVRDQ